MQRPLFLTQLRTATDAAHKSLEESPLSVAITSADLSPEDYAEYLNRMLLLHSAIEAFAFPLLSDLFPDIEKRSKISWLEHDLNVLAYCTDGLQKQKDYPSTVAFALGMMYVAEGSSLGGRVILKNVEKTLPEAAKATRFFSGYGENTGPFWKAFLEVLDSWQEHASEEEKNEMIKGAVSGFELAATILGAEKTVITA